jgi:hypothetical protein
MKKTRSIGCVEFIIERRETQDRLPFYYYSVPYDTSSFDMALKISIVAADRCFEADAMIPKGLT